MSIDTETAGNPRGSQVRVTPGSMGYNFRTPRSTRTRGPGTRVLAQVYSVGVFTYDDILYIFF
jgi:hypothetical protein